MSIVSLIFGISGFFTFGLLAVPGIILGILSFINIKNDPSLKGQGLALGGIILSSIILFFFYSILNVLFYVIIILGKLILVGLSFFWPYKG